MPKSDRFVVGSHSGDIIWGCGNSETFPMKTLERALLDYKKLRSYTPAKIYRLVEVNPETGEVIDE